MPFLQFAPKAGILGQEGKAEEKKQKQKRAVGCPGGEAGLRTEHPWCFLRGLALFATEQREVEASALENDGDFGGEQSGGSWLSMRPTGYILSFSSFILDF